MGTPPLDLHSIAVLLTHEVAGTEPRFRHTKLREVTLDDAPFKTILCKAGAWDDLPSPKRGFVFDQVATGPATEFDLPTNLLPASGKVVTANLLSERDLETIFHEARAHDGCYRSISVLQHFFDLYEPSQLLRIRTAASRQNDLTIPISGRVILEFVLSGLQQRSVSAVQPSGTFRITGASSNRPDSMDHAVWGFGAVGSETVTHILDLASMQFGDEGRGEGGELFRLNTMDVFYDGLEKVARGSHRDAGWGFHKRHCAAKGKGKKKEAAAA
ncbi:hypothetical protein RQP46_004513 [Phenoliferia psychrophenolica]